MELPRANTELVNRMLELEQEMKQLRQESVVVANVGHQPVSKRQKYQTLTTV